MQVTEVTHCSFNRDIYINLNYTDVNWMFMGSSQTSFFCRSCSCWWCWLLPACIRSFKWKVPGTWLSVTITVCRSGSLKKKKKTCFSKTTK